MVLIFFFKISKIITWEGKTRQSLFLLEKKIPNEYPKNTGTVSDRSKVKIEVTR